MLSVIGFNIVFFYKEGKDLEETLFSPIWILKPPQWLFLKFTTNLPSNKVSWDWSSALEATISELLVQSTKLPANAWQYNCSLKGNNAGLRLQPYPSYHWGRLSWSDT